MPGVSARYIFYCHPVAINVLVCVLKLWVKMWKAVNHINNVESRGNIRQDWLIIVFNLIVITSMSINSCIALTLLHTTKYWSYIMASKLAKYKGMQGMQGLVEDEYHLLFTCSTYSNLWKLSWHIKRGWWLEYHSKEHN